MESVRRGWLERILMWCIAVIVFVCLFFGLGLVGVNLKLGALLIIGPLLFLFWVAESEDDDDNDRR